jgi:hypothetical protein
MTGSQIATDYAAISIAITVLGVCGWLAAWRATTLLVRLKPRRLTTHPGLVQKVLAFKRINLWMVVIGLVNFTGAVVVGALIS